MIAYVMCIYIHIYIYECVCIYNDIIHILSAKMIFQLSYWKCIGIFYTNKRGLDDEKGWYFLGGMAEKSCLDLVFMKVYGCLQGEALSTKGAY